MPECEGCHKGVRRIMKYAKTGQRLREACVAALTVHAGTARLTRRPRGWDGRRDV